MSSPVERKYTDTEILDFVEGLLIVYQSICPEVFEEPAMKQFFGDDLKTRSFREGMRNCIARCRESVSK